MAFKSYFIMSLFSLLWSFFPNTLNYTATYEMTVTGNPQKSIMIFQNQAGIKSRQQMISPSQKTDTRGFQTRSKDIITIIKRQDLKLIWELNPYEKTYSIEPLDAPGMPITPIQTKIGEENILGHQCDIITSKSVLLNIMGFKDPIKNWVAKDIPGQEVVLKSESGENENKVTTQATQFSLDKLDNSLFEIPKEYEQVKSVNVPTIIDNHFLQLKQKPELYDISLDLDTIKYNKIDQKDCVDVWLRVAIPQKKPSDQEVKEWQIAGITIEGYEKYGYYLVHHLLSTDGKLRSICYIYYSLDGKEMRKEEKDSGWTSIQPDSFGETLYNAILYFTYKNEDMLRGRK